MLGSGMRRLENVNMNCINLPGRHSLPLRLNPIAPRTPHPGKAHIQNSPGKALRLFGFVLGVDSLKMQTDKKISGGPLALKRVGASPSPCDTRRNIRS